MKTIALALAATSFASAPAFAGAYINAEVNDGYTGTDYSGRAVDLHVGWEGSVSKLDYYVQGGPAVVAEDGVDSETNLSGKVGASIAATDKLDFYGEVSVLTDEDVDNSWGTKIGTKYKF